jgi:hypothetical protein
MRSCVDAGGVEPPYTGFIRTVRSPFRHASVRKIYYILCQCSSKIVFHASTREIAWPLQNTKALPQH